MRHLPFLSLLRRLIPLRGAVGRVRLSICIRLHVRLFTLALGLRPCFRLRAAFGSGFMFRWLCDTKVNGLWCGVEVTSSLGTLYMYL